MSYISYPKYNLPSDLSVNTLTSSNGIAISNLGNGLNNQYLGINSTGNIIATSSMGVGQANKLTQPCHNNTGVAIDAYKIVHIVGNTSADIPRVTLADWSIEASSSNVLGITSASIGIGADGEAVVHGVITGVNLGYLSGLQNGQILYLSSSGQITNIKPEAPKHMVTVGQVVSKATTGNNVTIYVSIQNGYELSELHNVSLVASSSGDLLSYDSVSGMWKNTKNLNGSYTLTGSLATGLLTIASAPYSHAEGNGAYALGLYSHAEGYNSIAYEESSHAEGVISTAGGVGSHAEGFNTQASGSYAHTEGKQTRTFAENSHAEGEATETYGTGSHAEGYACKTNGNYSHAEGFWTATNADYQHVQGKYNAISTTALMLVGNGTSVGSRKNILEVYNDRVVISGSLSASLGNSFSGSFVGNGSGLTNLPSQALAFSPIDVGSSDQAPTAATTQYYYQTVAGATMTISKVKVWGYSGSDNVLFGIYRGSLAGTMTLIGEGSATCNVGPNVIDITAKSGQNLNVTSGEDLVVGIYQTGASWRTVYRSGISDIRFGILNTGTITSMPASPTGTVSTIRFACTIY